MAAKYTLFLIDDHQSLLDGLKAALSVFPHITIVGMASDYESSIAQISKKTFNADIVVTDHALGSDLDGLDLCRAVKQLQPDQRVVLLTMHSSDALRYRAQRAGVSHFIVKSCTIDEIVKQLDAVMNNESMSFCATNTQEIERAPAALSPDLSARELEVLALIACEELTTKEIAERLHRSVQTIETHRAHLFQKLGVDSVVGLVKYAMSSNLCSERSNDHHSGSA